MTPYEQGYIAGLEKVAISPDKIFRALNRSTGSGAEAATKALKKAPRANEVLEYLKHKSSLPGMTGHDYVAMSKDPTFSRETMRFLGW